MSNNDATNQFITGGFNTNTNLERAFQDYEDSYGGLLDLKPDAAILDVGSGTGVFLKYLKQKGLLNAAGIDASREMIEFCQNENEVYTQHVTDILSFLSERKDSYDFVFLNDVIEHFPREDVIQNLRAIYEALKADGQVVIKTGNTATLAGFYLRHKDFTHYLGFTEYSLKQVLLVAGFKDINLTGNKIQLLLRPKRMIRVLSVRVIETLYRLYYALHYGEGCPTIFSKLLIASARK